MPRIRVLVGGVPQMLVDIITGLVETQGDMLVAGVAGPGADLPSVVDGTRPDVVILGLDDPEIGSLSAQLLTQQPGLRVIGVSADGRRSFLYQVRPCRVPLGELSAQGLVEAIRDRVRPDVVNMPGSDGRSA